MADEVPSIMDIERGTANNSKDQKIEDPKIFYSPTEVGVLKTGKNSINSDEDEDD